MNIQKVQRKKLNFNNQLKFADNKIFCIDVYKNYGGHDIEKLTVCS